MSHPIDSAWTATCNCTSPTVARAARDGARATCAPFHGQYSHRVSVGRLAVAPFTRPDINVYRYYQEETLHVIARCLSEVVLDICYCVFLLRFGSFLLTVNFLLVV